MDERIELIRKWINDDQAMNILIKKNHPIINMLQRQAKTFLSTKKEYLLEQKTALAEKISNFQLEVTSIDEKLIVLNPIDAQLEVEK